MHYVEQVCVVHALRGAGFVVSVQAFHTPKPFKVRFDSGEEHDYSLNSALKLQVKKVTKQLQPPNQELTANDVMARFIPPAPPKAHLAAG